MAGTTTVILGGGGGGLVTANELRKRVSSEHRVVLVDQGGKHVFWPPLLWLQVGLREPGRVVRDLSALEKKGIEVIKAEVTRIDPEKKVVEVGGEEVRADYIVVSLGARLAPELVPGLAEAGHNLYTLEGATAIRDRPQAPHARQPHGPRGQHAVQVPRCALRSRHAARARPPRAQGSRRRGRDPVLARAWTNGGDGAGRVGWREADGRGA